MRVDRRGFLTVAGLASAGALLPFDARALEWTDAEAILRRIKPPTFPDRTFDIKRFGATDADATEAFRRAIDACHAAGGGRVIVPAGRWTTGPIVLRSHVNLHLEDDATIAFSQDPKAYLPAVFT